MISTRTIKFSLCCKNKWKKLHASCTTALQWSASQTSTVEHNLWTVQM